MKTWFINFGVGLALVVWQTTLGRMFVPAKLYYDLFVPWILFCRLSLSGGQGLGLVVILGVFMDVLSGGILGLFVTIYLWIYLFVTTTSGYFNLESYSSRAAVIALCVVFECFVLDTSAATLSGGVVHVEAQVGSIFWQVFFALLSGPIIVELLGKMHTRWLAFIADSEKGKSELAV